MVQSMSYKKPCATNQNCQSLDLSKTKCTFLTMYNILTYIIDQTFIENITENHKTYLEELSMKNQ